MKNSGDDGLPQAPRYLSREAKGWWNRLVAEWELDDAALLLLGSALECLDRMRQAQHILDSEGITTRDRFGQVRQHPATLVERDAKAGLLRNLKALNLDLEPLREAPGRPPGR